MEIVFIINSLTVETQKCQGKALRKDGQQVLLM